MINGICTLGVVIGIIDAVLSMQVEQELSTLIVSVPPDSLEFILSAATHAIDMRHMDSLCRAF